MYTLLGLGGTQVSAFPGLTVPRMGSAKVGGGGCRHKLFSLASFPLFPAAVFQNEAEALRSRSACFQGSPGFCESCGEGVELGPHGGGKSAQAQCWRERLPVLERAELKPGAGAGGGASALASRARRRGALRGRGGGGGGGGGGSRAGGF